MLKKIFFKTSLLLVIGSFSTYYAAEVLEDVLQSISEEQTTSSNHVYAYIPDDGRLSYEEIMASSPTIIDDSHVAKYMMAAAESPASVDLSADFPMPFTQGKLGCCSCASLASALAYDEKKRTDEAPETKSVLYLYYWSRFLIKSVAHDSGISLSDGIVALQKFGICKESLHPYKIENFAQRPPREAYIDAIAYRDQLDKQRIGKVSQDLNVIKAMLNRGAPIVFGMRIYDSFEGKEVENTGILRMPEEKEKYKGSHAVVMAGYNDDINGGSILIRNSWGPKWGTNFSGDHSKTRGYFWLPYKYVTNKRLAYDFWTLSDNPDAKESADTEVSFFQKFCDLLHLHSKK